jgi:hypothetical protein
MQKVNPKLSAACFVIGRLQYEYHISCPPPERRKEIAAQLHRFSAQLTNADRYQWITPDCPQCATNCSHEQSTNKAETAKPNGSRHSVTDEQLAAALDCALGTQDQQVMLDDVVNRIFTAAADELATLEKEYHEEKSRNGRTDEISSQLMIFKQHMFAADVYGWIMQVCAECLETCDHDYGPKAIDAMPRAQRASIGN